MPDQAAYEAHAQMLRKLPHCQELPTACFEDFIAHPRINNERLSFMRKDFFDRFQGVLQEPSREAAVLKLHALAASYGDYRPSDDRTISVQGFLNRSYGRCGEETVFLCDCFRALGFPARQVYVPWWTHTDDNHAFVEVFLDRQWRHLGALEYEPCLDRGWYDEAIQRAPLLLARRPIERAEGCSDKALAQKGLYRDGSLLLENRTAAYRPCHLLTLRLTDQSQRPLKGARLSLEVLNEGRLKSLIRLQTDAQGETQIALGTGPLLISYAGKAGAAAQAIFLDTAQSLVLQALPQAPSKRKAQALKAFAFWKIPEGPAQPALSQSLAKNKERIGRQAKEALKVRRERWEEASRQAAKTYPDKRVLELFLAAGGNWPALQNFLDQAMKLAPFKTCLDFLACQPPKDLADLDPALYLKVFSGIYPRLLPLRLEAEEASAWPLLAKELGLASKKSIEAFVQSRPSAKPKDRDPRACRSLATLLTAPLHPEERPRLSEALFLWAGLQKARPKGQLGFPAFPQESYVLQYEHGQDLPLDIASTGHASFQDLPEGSALFLQSRRLSDGSLLLQTQSLRITEEKQQLALKPLPTRSQALESPIQLPAIHVLNLKRERQALQGLLGKEGCLLLVHAPLGEPEMALRQDLQDFHKESLHLWPLALEEEAHEAVQEGLVARAFLITPEALASLKKALNAGPLPWRLLVLEGHVKGMQCGHVVNWLVSCQ